MAATVTIPAVFRKRFDAEVPAAVECVKDPENDYSAKEAEEADELARRVEVDGDGALTVSASSAAVVALIGCIIKSEAEIPSEDAPNDPEVRRDAESAILDLLRWYGIASEIPEEVRG